MNRSLAVLFCVALAGAPEAAHADFYSVEGRFQCLDKPGAVCFDAVVPPRESLLTPPAASPSPTAPEAARTAELAPPEPAPQPAVRQAPPDPVLAIASRIRLERPAAGDVAALHGAAEAGDTRALELLAWCELQGIGTAPNAMAAYELYGKAAAAAVPHAAENQKLVFERDLTSDERQLVLERAARAEPAPAKLAAGRTLPEIP